MEFTTQEPVPPPYLTATVLRRMKKEKDQKGLFFRLRLFDECGYVFEITEFTVNSTDNTVEIKAKTVVEKQSDAENIIINFDLSRREYTWRTDLLPEAEYQRPVKEGGSKKRTKKRKTKKRKTRKRKTKRNN